MATSRIPPALTVALALLVVSPASAISAVTDVAQATRPIAASAPWNATDVKLEAGRRYEIRLIEIVGLKDGDGRHAKPLDDLDGWDHWLLIPLAFMKRRAFEPYFALIGTIDRKHAFRLSPREGQPQVITAPASGELYCYFNDWRSRYHNNYGHVRLSFRLLE